MPRAQTHSKGQCASAQSRLCAAQAVANYTSQIYSDAQVANGELKGAEAASYLQSALKEVEKPNRNSHFRIEQMANAGFAAASQADARIDLDSAQIVKMDIENALDQITDWQSENEAATKVQLLVSELTSDIATSKDALGAYGQINEFRSSTGLQSVS